MKTKLIVCCCCISLLACGSKKKQPLCDFAFTYTMEVIQQYKVSFSFDSQKRFRTEIANHYMDKVENKRRPEIKAGRLTDEQFDRLKTLLEEADLPSMKEDYGFDRRTQASQDILVQLILTQGEEKKYISILYNREQRFPPPFVRLMSELNRFLKR